MLKYRVKLFGELKLLLKLESVPPSMNDSLLRNEPTFYSEKRALSDGDSEISDTNLDTPEKYAEGFNLMRLDRVAKNKITINKIKMIILLTLLPMAAIVYSFFDYQWFLMVETREYQYWVNLVALEKVCQNMMSLPFCQVPGTLVYSATTVFLYHNSCQYGDLTSDDPINLCSVLVSYYYSGLIAASIVAVGFLVHLLHIAQMIEICRRGNTQTIKFLDPQKVPYLIMFLYVSPLVYWFFASATPINSNTMDSMIIFQRIGSSFIIYAAAAISFIGLSIFFQRVFAQGIRRNLVNDLLNAEIRYIEGLGPINEAEIDIENGSEKENESESESENENDRM